MTVLKERRLAAGMTRKQLSEAAGVPLRSIETWESGRFGGAHLESAVKVADALELYVEQLLTYDYDDVLMIQVEEDADESDD